MDFETELKRVAGGAKDALKALITKLGGTVADEKIDGYASLAEAIELEEVDFEEGQPKITASGILKGDGNGGVTPAAVGTDYEAPGAASAALTEAKAYSDSKFAEVVHPNEITLYEAVIGTAWTGDTTAGVKTQTISLEGVAAADTARMDVCYSGDGNADSYTTFTDQKNQFMDYIQDGFAETVDGGLKLTIFGDANTMNIPILVEVIHHEPIG